MPTKPTGVQDLEVVVESKPGAPLRVERVVLSDADVQALTTSTQIQPGGESSPAVTPAGSDSSK
jgi:hypothetical protein